MAENSVEMVIIDGVRYHPDDVPEQKVELEEKAAAKPANKSRTARTK